MYSALRSFKDYFIDIHVKMFSESRTGTMIIIKMQENKNSQNYPTVKDIWLLCLSNMWLTHTHIPGVKNNILIRESRKIGEWILNQYFKKMSKILIYTSQILTVLLDVFEVS